MAGFGEVETTRPPESFPTLGGWVALAAGDCPYGCVPIIEDFADRPDVPDFFRSTRADAWHRRQPVPQEDCPTWKPGLGKSTPSYGIRDTL